MRPQYTSQQQVRTQADKLAEAIRFVWGAADRVIAETTADQLARMKGVTTKAGVASIGAALMARKGRLS